MVRVAVVLIAGSTPLGLAINHQQSTINLLQRDIRMQLLLRLMEAGIVSVLADEFGV